MNHRREYLASLGTLAVVLWISVTAAWAGLGPENVAVVVNDNSWASKAVANQFVHLRNIPARNVIYLDLSDMNDFEVTTVSRFRDRVLRPVLEAIRERGLSRQIDCVAWSSDIPYAANFKEDLKGSGRHTLAAITGLTFLYQSVLDKDPRYASTTTNRYFRRSIRPRPTPWRPEQSKLLGQARRTLAAKGYDQAEPVLRQLLRQRPQDGILYFGLAQCRAAKGDANAAMDLLFQAAEHHYRSARAVAAAPEFEPLKTHKDYKRLLAVMGQPVQYKDIDIQTPVAFRSATRWDAGGNPVTDDTGTGYMLSTMLAVTSGRGSAISDVWQTLGRSAKADFQRPKGTIYLMVNNDIRSKTRQWAFAAVVDKLGRIGVRAVAMTGHLPGGKSDVMGIAAGNAFFNIPKAKMTILPGAICENLTSWGGVMVQNGGQVPLTDFLDAGAAGSSGTVVEPFAIQNKFPSPFLYYIYAQGFTLAEAYYQSVQGPYQLLVVGDPLCRPWARTRRVRLEGLTQGMEVKGKLPVKPVAVPGGDEVTSFEIYVDGQWVASYPPGKDTHMRTEGGSDGYHELRCVAISADPTATCISETIGFTVNNRGHNVLARPAGPTTVPLGQPIRISAIAKGAAKLSLHHNTRELATAKGDKATFSIDSDRVGMGPVRLEVLAEFASEDKTWRVSATPLVITVSGPLRIGPDAVAPAGLQVGLKLTVAGKPPVPSIDLRKQNTKKMGLAKGDHWTLEGVISSSKNDVYQLQVQPGKISSLKVGSRSITLDDRQTGWQLIPLTLVAGGKYRLEIKGTATGNRLPDIRFGRAGARTLNVGNTMH